MYNIYVTVSLYHCITVSRKTMVPIIIECDDQEKISQYLSERYYLQNLVGQVKPENDFISLNAIKFLIDRAKFSPGQKQAVFLITDGHLITPAGQNALLKTLEESLPEQQFIITTKNRHLLLPTIISRCQVIAFPPVKDAPSNNSRLADFAKNLTKPAGNIGQSDKIGSDKPKDYLRLLIEDLRAANRNFPTPKRVAIISYAATCLSDLARNVNPKLALDHFLLQSGTIIKKST